MTLTPYYDDDPTVTLWQGDGLAVLADLAAGSVDALITDPPYSSGGQFRGDRAQDTRTKYQDAGSANGALENFTGDTRDGHAYRYWCALWLTEAARVVIPGGVCALFTDWRQLPTTTDALQSGGWVWRGIVPWYKPAARPVLGRWTNACEYLVWGTNGPRDTTTGETFPGFYQASSPRDREHVTQKPLSIMRDLVKVVPPGGVVLDPFMGAGTTGVAAVLEGRRFVGAELVLEYATTAERRIRVAQLQAIPRGDQAAFDLGTLGP